jgi:hypothetical protein
VWVANVGVFVKVSRGFCWSLQYNAKMRLDDLIKKLSRQYADSPRSTGRRVVSLALRPFYSQYALTI